MLASTNRTLIVSDTPAFLVATHHRPSEIAIVTTSFVRARSPSERRLTIFVQSSANPSSAHANAPPNTPIDCASRVERIRNGIANAITMMIPPIVGVPALVLWPAGPSSRMFWPNSRRRRNSMNLGLRNRHSEQRRGTRDQDTPGDRAHQACGPRAVGRGLGRLQRPAHPLETDRERALDQHHVTGADQLGNQVGRRRRVGHGVDLAAERLGDRLGQRPDRDQQPDAGAGHLLAELDVVAARTRTELAHVSEYGHQPAVGRAPGGLHEVLEGGAHRHRVGVVAAIDQGHVPGKRDVLTAPGGQLERDATLQGSRRPRPRRPPRAGGCGADAPA